MKEIRIDTRLYGELRRFGGPSAQASHANLQINLPEGSTMSDLLSILSMPSEARGITFINGALSAMPGLQPDLQHPLQDGDRVTFFDLRSMWPFQYRHGVPMIGEMKTALLEEDDQGLHHAYEGE